MATYIHRNMAADTLRVLAIVAVISIHTAPYLPESAELGRNLDMPTFVNMLARFAVPLFFIFSGYFWAAKVETTGNVLIPSVEMLKRISYLFIFWSLIYLLPTNILEAIDYGWTGPLKRFYWNIQRVMTHPMDLLFQGTKIHLWFLAGLLWSVAISWIFVSQNKKISLILLALLLYIVGLAGKAYSTSPLGFQVDFDFRNGPFFSLIFFVTGYFLYENKKTLIYTRVGVIIALFGVIMHFLELIAINKIWGINMAQDYVIGTYFYGLGVAIIGLSNAQILQINRASSIAPAVLGIYASHYIFVDLLRPANRYFAGSQIWTLVYICIVFFLSYKLSITMSKYSLSKKLVS